MWSYAGINEIGSNETLNQNKVLGGQPIIFFCRVVDSNSSWPVFGYNVSFYNESNYIGSNLTNATGYAVHNYTEPNPNPANYTISCNISDQPGIFYDASIDNSDGLILQVIEDPYPPVIYNFWFEQQNVVTNGTNLYSNLTIFTKISDNLTSIKNASVNITYPDNTSVIENMDEQAGGVWRFVFNENETGVALNQTGNYSAFMTTYDIADNANSSEKENFTVYSTYTVTMTDYVENLTYNLGENLTLYATDVNGLVVPDVNWTFVNITRFGENETNLTNESGYLDTAFVYFVNPTDSLGNWTLRANVSKSGNTGSGTFYFNVTDVLMPYFLPDLYAGRRYGLSRNVNADTPIKARVNYSRVATAEYNMSVNLSYGGVNYTLGKEGGTPTYSNASITITTPGEYDTPFTIHVYASDQYNNTGYNSITMRTVVKPSTNGGSPSSSSPFTGAPAPVCNCTEWVDDECGIGNCTSFEMSQTRTCLPSGCDVESRCISHPQCAEKHDFEFYLSENEIELQQGKYQKVRVTVNNTGNAAINVTLTAESDCIYIQMPNEMNLGVGASGDVFMTLHVPLNQTPDVCEVTAILTSGSTEKTKGVGVTVTRNEDLIILEEQQQKLLELESRISELSSSGVDVTGLLELKTQTEQLIQQAMFNVQSDDSTSLGNNVDELAALVIGMENSMTLLSIYKFVLDNRLYIITIIVLSIMISYMVTQVLLPFSRLGKDMVLLAKKEKELVLTRVNTEKQYFKRQIDERTFQSILAKKQEEILKTRGQLSEMTNERNNLIKSRLSPVSLGNWLVGGPKRLYAKLKGREKKPEPAQGAAQAQTG
jgi:hypothetical protein